MKLYFLRLFYIYLSHLRFWKHIQLKPKQYKNINNEPNISSIKRNTLSNQTSSSPRKQKLTVDSTNTKTIQEQGIFSSFRIFLFYLRESRKLMFINQPKNTFLFFMYFILLLFKNEKCVFQEHSFIVEDFLFYLYWRILVKYVITYTYLHDVKYKFFNFQNKKFFITRDCILLKAVLVSK